MTATLARRPSQVVTKLHEILRPFLLRRLKKDVLIDMPPKKEVVVYTPMSLLQKDYYALAQEGKLRDKLLAMGLSGGRDCSQINLNMNLRKISNHPFLFGEPIDSDGLPMCDARPELLVTASGKFKVSRFAHFLPHIMHIRLRRPRCVHCPRLLRRPQCPNRPRLVRRSCGAALTSSPAPSGA